MIDESLLRDRLQDTLQQTSFPEGIAFERGKVRDWCWINENRVLVTTDRISAFDRVLGTIPCKGQVLNQIAQFWFEHTQDVVPNAYVATPDPNVMIMRECKQLSLEFVVRGYLTGVTKTSAWTNYANGARVICGNELPDGLRKDQKLDHPILTPTTKHEEHDRNISRDEAISEGLIDAATFDKAADICMKLYQVGVEYAATRGLILVDTKYELGVLDGELVVSDEVNTPDSSRYWFADNYEACFQQEMPQKQLDKEYVRTWLADKNFRGEGEPPVLTDEVRLEAARRYIQAYELVTGKRFDPGSCPIEDRVKQALQNLK
jgi:phosphoribosylaminoimidazole-succinocarboxamide synthase